MADEMNDRDVILSYPELFGVDITPQKTAMCFGFEVSKPWREIVLAGLPKLSKIVRDNKLDDFRIRQVKEKFGSLRVYTNYITDETDEVIDQMEDECAHTCEKCGSKEGVLRENNWFRVTCNKCEAISAEKRRQEN